MKVLIQPGVRLFIDIEVAALVPDGPRWRDKPTLLLLHGGPGFDHSSFKPLFGEVLADIAQVITLDHRGHGRSTPRPVSEVTLDTLADDIVRLCEVLGIEKPVVLGQSFGGFVAQRYLAKHPAHPARVILSSTSHHFGLERKLAMFEQLGGPASRAAAEAFWLAPGPATWDDYETHCRPHYNRTVATNDDAKRRTSFNAEILYGWSSRYMPTLDLRPGLAAVQCPVLVMAGTRDPVTPVEDAREIAAAIPAQWSRLVEFPGAGHGAWRDDPEPAMALIREFVAGDAA
jgi:pimeloyl-ACP methyl ester carboxylesterase